MNKSKVEELEVIIAECIINAKCFLANYKKILRNLAQKPNDYIKKLIDILSCNIIDEDIDQNKRFFSLFLLVKASEINIPYYISYMSTKRDMLNLLEKQAQYDKDKSLNERGKTFFSKNKSNLSAIEISMGKNYVRLLTEAIKYWSTLDYTIQNGANINDIHDDNNSKTSLKGIKEDPKESKKVNIYIQMYDRLIATNVKFGDKYIVIGRNIEDIISTKSPSTSSGTQITAASGVEGGGNENGLTIPKHESPLQDGKNLKKSRLSTFSNDETLTNEGNAMINNIKDIFQVINFIKDEVNQLLVNNNDKVLDHDMYAILKNMIYKDMAEPIQTLKKYGEKIFDIKHPEANMISQDIFTEFENYENCLNASELYENNKLTYPKFKFKLTKWLTEHYTHQNPNQNLTTTPQGNFPIKAKSIEEGNTTKQNPLKNSTEIKKDPETTKQVDKKNVIKKLEKEKSKDEIQNDGDDRNEDRSDIKNMDMESMNKENMIRIKNNDQNKEIEDKVDEINKPIEKIKPKSKVSTVKKKSLVDPKNEKDMPNENGEALKVGSEALNNERKTNQHSRVGMEEAEIMKMSTGQHIREDEAKPLEGSKRPEEDRPRMNGLVKSGMESRDEDAIKIEKNKLNKATDDDDGIGGKGLDNGKSLTEKKSQGKSTSNRYVGIDEYRNRTEEEVEAEGRFSIENNSLDKKHKGNMVMLKDQLKDTEEYYSPLKLSTPQLQGSNLRDSIRAHGRSHNVSFITGKKYYSPIEISTNMDYDQKSVKNNVRRDSIDHENNRVKIMRQSDNLDRSHYQQERSSFKGRAYRSIMDDLTKIENSLNRSSRSRSRASDMSSIQKSIETSFRIVGKNPPEFEGLNGLKLKEKLEGMIEQLQREKEYYKGECEDLRSKAEENIKLKDMIKDYKTQLESQKHEIENLRIENDKLRKQISINNKPLSPLPQETFNENTKDSMSLSKMNNKSLIEKIEYLKQHRDTDKKLKKDEEFDLKMKFEELKNQNLSITATLLEFKAKNIALTSKIAELEELHNSTISLSKFDINSPYSKGKPVGMPMNVVPGYNFLIDESSTQQNLGKFQDRPMSQTKASDMQKLSQMLDKDPMLENVKTKEITTTFHHEDDFNGSTLISGQRYILNANKTIKGVIIEQDYTLLNELTQSLCNKDDNAYVGVDGGCSNEGLGNQDEGMGGQEGFGGNRANGDGIGTSNKKKAKHVVKNSVMNKIVLFKLNCLMNNCIVYEDNMLQIGFKNTIIKDNDKNKNHIKLALYYGNKLTNNVINEFNITTNIQDNNTIQLVNKPKNIELISILPKKQMKHEIIVNILQFPFSYIEIHCQAKIDYSPHDQYQIQGQDQDQEKEEQIFQSSQQHHHYPQQAQPSVYHHNNLQQSQQLRQQQQQHQQQYGPQYLNIKFILPLTINKLMEFKTIECDDFKNRWKLQNSNTVRTNELVLDDQIAKNLYEIKCYFNHLIDLNPLNEYEYILGKKNVKLGGCFVLDRSDIEYLLKIIILPNQSIILLLNWPSKYQCKERAIFILQTLSFLFQKS